nr:MAG TPA: Major capsid protein [Bacteriophage sp.]
MAITKAIGKNTVGDGNKMTVRLNNYYRSTHDLSYVWKNTQAAGPIVPFLCEYAQIDDTHEIDLSAMVITHPTVGPLYGSFKLQLDVYVAPIRLYQKLLHNNTMGIGLDMSKVKLPSLNINLKNSDNPTKDNQFSQINPSALLAYLGLRGWGLNENPNAEVFARKNAVPLLAYWDIFKNYYANKQEEIAYMISTNGTYLNGSVARSDEGSTTINDFSKWTTAPAALNITYVINVNKKPANGINKASLNNILIEIGGTGSLPDKKGRIVEILGNPTQDDTKWTWTIEDVSKIRTIYRITYQTETILNPFQLSIIDETRENILAAPSTMPYVVNSGIPYLYAQRDKQNKLLTTQPMYGLALKTYQSDIFNNWIQTEWLEGENGINAITAIDTSSGSFTMDTLNLAKKVYNMLNRIAVSDGTYKSWMETVFSSKYVERTETPVYYGGMSQEIIFEEVISTSAAASEPLGTLAGKGRLAPNKKGGKIVIKIDEPSYIIGICSITPRLDYSQGNNFTMNWETLNDVHKPALDMIGYQDLTMEKAAWWTETWNEKGGRSEKKIGKTVAWIDYMTNYNKNYGNFASGENENFMVLDRNYNIETKDFTTYIDPAKYNGIFADQSRSAMNFWIQIGVDWKVRRKISAKSIPNL